MAYMNHACIVSYWLSLCDYIHVIIYYIYLVNSFINSVDIKVLHISLSVVLSLGLIDPQGLGESVSGVQCFGSSNSYNSCVAFVFV